MNNKNIILIGMPGAGKTTLGKIIKDKFNLDYNLVDMDDEIEKMEKSKIKDIFKNKGEEYFRDLESQLSEELASQEKLIISTGGGIVLNFENILLLKKRGIVIFIDRPIEDILSDFDGKNRPLVFDNMKKLHELYDNRIELYRKYNDYSIPNNKDLGHFVFAMRIILRKEGIL